MGNDEPAQKVQISKPVRPIEVKTYVMTCQNKMTLYRNKKVYEIKKKKDEAIAALKQNNLDIAKAKMESIIRLEDQITVYDILGPLCEILKERITYLCTATEPPPDIRAQLDTIMYASTRLDIDDLYKLRHLVKKKFGSYYVEAAEQNKDGLVNINVVEKLRIKPPVDAFLTIRLKQLCKEKRINYEFPEEIEPNFDQGMGNPYGGGNPYDNNNGMGMGGNPYDPYGGSGNNNNNGGNDFDSYMRNSKAVGNNNNFGGNNNNFGGDNNNFNMGKNPYESNNFNMNNNPYEGNMGGNPYDNNNMNNNMGSGMGNSKFGGGDPYGNNNFGDPFNDNNNNNMGDPFNNNNNMGDPFNENNNKYNQSQFGNNPSQFGNNNMGSSKLRSTPGQSQMGGNINSSKMGQSNIGQSKMGQSKMGQSKK